jgi:hypothetical protein
MNCFNIENAYRLARERGWDKAYWAIDIHGTMLKSDYKKDSDKEFYPMAKETLQMLSNRPDVCLILYTCSYPDEIKAYIEFFKGHDIHFHYANENPEAANNKHGYFQAKPYFNILLEDKAGFSGDEDWLSINETISKIPLLTA